MQNELSHLPPPPRLMNAFTTGFDAITKHITLIALPVLVDLFLWLGPHLKLDRFLLPFFDTLLSYNNQSSVVSAESVALAQEGWTELLAQFNLFAALRTFPVGPASLMSYHMPLATPLGQPILLQPDSFLTVAGWVLLVILAGWVLGSLYFHAVSNAALGLPNRAPFQAMLQVALLSLFWLGVLAVIGIPAVFLVSLLNMISPMLSQLALILAAMVALWVILPVFFSPHGIFAGRLDAAGAIRGSLKMIRYTLPTSGLFLLGFLLIGQGLDLLWSSPPENSWWTLVGIAGHGFISTALLASSFVYYRDVNTWLFNILEQLKKKTPAPAKA